MYEPFLFILPTCIHGCASLSTHRLREDLNTSTHTFQFPFLLARKKTRHHFITSKGQRHRAVRADSVSLRLTLSQRYTFSSTHTHKREDQHEEPAEIHTGRAKYERTLRWELKKGKHTCIKSALRKQHVDREGTSRIKVTRNSKHVLSLTDSTHPLLRINIYGKITEQSGTGHRTDE